MATLANTEGAATNGECVACHATPKQTGPRSSAVGDYRVEDAVGCESCHGPGSRHVEAGGGTDNIERLGDDCPVCVIEAVCTSCHTAEWDKTWHLETKLPKVHHNGRHVPQRADRPVGHPSRPAH